MHLTMWVWSGWSSNMTAQKVEENIKIELSKPFSDLKM